MAVCFINNKEYEIKLANTPLVKKWLEIYNNITFKLHKSFDKTTVEDLYNLLSKHHKFFSKMTFNFSSYDKESLWNKQTLSKIHLQIVKFQKNYKKSTDLLNRNTNNDWDLLHDLLHKLEIQIREKEAEFSVGDSDLTHDSQGLTKNWSWDPRLTPQEFMDSASFDRWHLNIPTAELGRHPYECYCYSPDTWKEEGSMLGQIPIRITVKLAKTYPTPDQGYYEWCNTLSILPLGNNFPLANFNENFIPDILNAEDIRIAQ